jgi:hypothetical protein
MIRNGSSASAPEITREMIAAGLAVIGGFELIDVWEGHLSKEELVRSIFLSMEEKRSQQL